MSEFDKRCEMLLEKGVIDTEGYVEVMGPDFDKGVALIEKAWDDWKKGPATENKMIKWAKKDVLRFIEGKLK